MIDVNSLKFNEQGLIPAIAQDSISGEVLMLAYMNSEALQKTLDTGKAHYFSRSRQNLWFKGESSGHYQTVKEMMLDCDSDTILLKVQQEGVACHTGKPSCFHQKIVQNGTVAEDVVPKVPDSHILEELYELVKERKHTPIEGSYTGYLFEKGLDKILKKVGEETSEVIIAAKNRSNDELRYEIADLQYHLIVLLVERGLKIEDVWGELQKRRK